MLLSFALTCILSKYNNNRNIECSIQLYLCISYVFHFCFVHPLITFSYIADTLQPLPEKKNTVF
jgi:hypothetical protein